MVQHTVSEHTHYPKAVGKLLRSSEGKVPCARANQSWMWMPPEQHSIIHSTSPNIIIYLFTPHIKKDMTMKQ